MSPRRRCKSLDEALAYRHPEVIHRFRDQWRVSEAEALALFDDLKRFLWLNVQPGAGALAPVPIIDEMWHCFLEFTADYRAWTTGYLGVFVDHLPTTKRAKVAIDRQLKVDRAAVQRREGKKLIATITKVYRWLGADTVIQWYVRYPARYTPAFFRTGRRAPVLPRVRIPPALRRLAAAS